MSGWSTAVLAVVLALAPLERARAQDANYWTRQFGNPAWLLGGALLDGPHDVSAVYYNPGALALLGLPEFQLTGNVFEYTRLLVKEGLFQGRDLSTSRLVGGPPFLAGELRFAFLGKSHLAYSFLTRQDFDFRIERHDPLEGGPVPSTAGLDVLSTQVRMEQDLSEYWAGLTWAYPLGPELGVGITAFGAVRNQRTRFQVLAQGYNDSQSLAAIQGRDFRYQHVRVLAKVGVTKRHGPWSFGLTVTTPGLAVWGRGGSGLDRTRVVQGQPDDGEGPGVVTDYQDGVRARYLSPPSVGAGVSRQLGAFVLHAAIEWFGPIATYTVLDTAPVVVRGTGEELSSDVLQGSAPVLNAAVGVEHHLTEQLRGYVSFHTDFSTATSVPGTNAVIAEWDLYHLAAGWHVPLGHSSFTLGADVALGNQRTTRLSEFLAGAGLPPPANPSRLRYIQATLILGASLQLEPTSTPEQTP